ncbi:hypothetical protein ACTHGU_11990 [Chitinophagaceae bacterium MMS25-I14]
MQQLKWKLFGAMAILIAGSGVFISCNKSDNSNNGNIKSLIVQGSWSVARSVDNGVDETSYYKNYRFTFLSTGIASATNDSATVSGVWQTTTENNENKLILSFTVPFGYLTEDWHIIQTTSEAIMLVNPGGWNGVDSLTLKKI